jgi:hypothetical protein
MSDESARKYVFKLIGSKTEYEIECVPSTTFGQVARLIAEKYPIPAGIKFFAGGQHRHETDTLNGDGAAPLYVNFPKPPRRTAPPAPPPVARPPPPPAPRPDDERPHEGDAPDESPVPAASPPAPDPST